MRQRAKGSTFRATAYHEAGHALVALHLGCGIKLATVVPDEKAATLGHVKRWSRPALVANLSETVSWREADHFLRPGEKPRPRARSRSWLEREAAKEIMIFLAGAVAEKLSGRSDRTIRIGASADFGYAADAAWK
jgi:hypothetical protein